MPTHELIAAIRSALAEHIPLEEVPGGVYEACERLVGAEVASLAFAQPLRSPWRHS